MLLEEAVHELEVVRPTHVHLALRHAWHPEGDREVWLPPIQRTIVVQVELPSQSMYEVVTDRLADFSDAALDVVCLRVRNDADPTVGVVDVSEEMVCTWPKRRRELRVARVVDLTDDRPALGQACEDTELIEDHLSYRSASQVRIGKPRCHNDAAIAHAILLRILPNELELCGKGTCDPATVSLEDMISDVADGALLIRMRAVFIPRFAVRELAVEVEDNELVRWNLENVIIGVRVWCAIPCHWHSCPW